MQTFFYGEFLGIFVILLLIGVAFATLAERKLMASMQRRKGPNVVGFFGLFQPIADGVKLFVKETTLPYHAAYSVFYFAPILILVLALYTWIYLPFGPAGQANVDLSLSLLYILIFNTLEVYGVLLAGWASNSKYAFFGGLRSAAQMLSYEISLSFIFLTFVFSVNSFNLIDIVTFQIRSGVWFIIPFLPLGIIFLISMLAETNRTPFDLPEAEAELVAGYNVEYSSLLFALFFLAEYATMLFLSTLFSLLFLGGWSFGICWKIIIILFFFVWARATLPRFRYDQLMVLGWKYFLPVVFGFFVWTTSIFYALGLFPSA